MSAGLADSGPTGAQPVTASGLRDGYGLYVGGEWSTSAADFPTLAPATEAPLARIALADAGDVDRAVRAARRGFEKYWRKLRPPERAKYIYRVARALGERARELANAESLDAGRPIRLTRDFDVPHAVATFFYYAGWADKLAWAVELPERARPLGVVAALTGADAPFLTAARTLAAALACGNTVVLKPSEATPSPPCCWPTSALKPSYPPASSTW